jgi:hypothetical protein
MHPLRAPVMSSRKRWISYAGAIGVLGLGLATSLLTADWAWFSRAGCVVVVIGIVLTSTLILERDRRLKSQRIHWEAQIRRDLRVHTAEVNPSRRDWAKETDLHSLDRSRTEDEGVWVREHDGLYLLVLGTLVWGFGDLLGLLVQSG